MVDRASGKEGAYMRLIALIAALFLFSCAGVSEQQKQDASDQYQVNLHRCDPIVQGYKNGVNSYVDVAYCMNQADNEYFIAIEFPYPEIIPLVNSYNLALAERVQAGEITPEQALRMDNQFAHELAAQAYYQRMAVSQQQLAWRELIRSLNTSYYMNRPITCIQTGNVFTCN